MTNETEHAALPWEHCGINGIHKRVSGHYATCIATTVGDNREANARHIVHCVNNHERLVEALRSVCDMQAKRKGNATDTHIELDDICVDLRALLAALEAEKGGEL